MRFVIDETSWDFNGQDHEQCVEALEAMLDRIDDASLGGFEVFYSEDLFNEPVYDGRTFYDLYADNSSFVIPEEVRVRVAAAFSRLAVWQEAALPWPDDFYVLTEAKPEPEYAPSIAWAHKQVTQDTGAPVACISHPIRRPSGRVQIKVADVSARLWFLSAARDSELAFRALIVESTRNPEEMGRLALEAFKGLDFVDGAFSGIKAMSKPYRDLVSDLVKHLSVLSDEGTRIFSLEWSRVPAEFGRYGLDISDENGNTKGNKAARSERTMVVNGEKRVFWWHSKIERHQDRIHVCPEKVRLGGKILVGIFCRHLTV